MSSKKDQFIMLYLDALGKSNLIKRDNLPGDLYYSSGDGIFRMDSGRFPEYKYCYFQCLPNKLRFSWDITSVSENINDKWLNFGEKLKILQQYRFLENEDLLIRVIKGKKKKGTKYIKFYGKKPIIPIKDKGIRSDIRETICSEPCCVCYTTQDVECDHKNDLKNDPRVLNKKTQTLDDFQPLCKHCNMLKKTAGEERTKTNKRIGATKYGYGVDFIIGDETLDKNDPNWYIGTYWGDVREFKKNLTLK